MCEDVHKNKPIGFFIIDYSTGGGVERVTANLMREFSEQGFQNLHLISLKSSLEQPVMNYPEMKGLKILSQSKNFAQELKDYLCKHHIRHLIFQGDNMTIGLEVLKAAKLANCKAYPQYHGSPYAYLKKYPDAEHANLLKRLFAGVVYPFKKSKLRKFIQSSPQGLFCVSNGSADELKHLFRGEKGIVNKIKVIHNPIVLPETSVLEKQKSIVLASRLESRHKNAFLAVKSWAIIAQDFPDWNLVILGDGSLKNKMESFCEEHHIKNVIFKGFVNNVEQYLETSAISLSVSNCEGFPMSIAEAITYGNVIVSTDSDGGIRDMLIHNQTALVSPKNDANAFAQNLSIIMKNKEMRELMVYNAHQNLKLFSQKHHAVRLWISVLFG